MHNYTEYFKSKEGFDRFIKNLYEKYKSLSSFSGSIKLNNLSTKEAHDLSLFFGTTYYEHDDIVIPIKRFIKVMERSKFSDFDIEVLVSEYLNKQLITKKEIKNQKDIQEKGFYDTLIGTENTPSRLWLKDVYYNKIPPYRLLQTRYRSNKDELKVELEYIMKMVDNLPIKKTLLPIFSSLYTQDPHYLDLENSHNILFIYALSYIDNREFPLSREEKITLLSKYNIEIDIISNYAITYNLSSNRDCINGFNKSGESLILNIQNIINTDTFNSANKKVFIFENPSILNEIMTKNIKSCIIISGGFPNSSVYMLLDKLIERGNKLYYNGDFDPEGLLIADKLKEKYRDNIELICYDEENYLRCVSRKKISDARLKKLSNIKSSELYTIKEKLQKEGYAGYQENNKEYLVTFIRNIEIKEKN